MEMSERRILCSECGGHLRRYGDYISIRVEHAKPGAKCNACGSTEKVMCYVTITQRNRKPITYSRRLRHAAD